MVSTADRISGPASRVYVIEDDKAVREGLAALLRSVGHRVTVYANGKEFLRAAHSNMRGCLVTDVRMPGLTGLELQRELRERGLRLPVIFVTEHGSINMAVRAMRANAFDFIEKPFEEDVLLDSVRKAVLEDLRRRPLDEWRAESCERWRSLTSREQQVTKLVADGLSNKDIGRELGISVRTVENHRAHAMSKLGAEGLAQAIRRVLSVSEPEIRPD